MEFAGEELEQGGLARAIRSDHADPVAPRHAQAEIADDRSAVERLAGVLGIDHDLGAHIVAAGNQGGRALRSKHRSAFGAHFLELREASLVAPPPSGDTPLQPMLFQLELGVEPLGVALLLGEDLLGPGVEPAIADLGAADRAAVEPQSLPGQPGQERAVVADNDERALEPVEPVLEPFDRHDVEMVGRLVEQQHVGILRQRANDSGAATLTARGRGCFAAEIDAELIGDRIGFVGAGALGPASTKSASVANPSTLGSCSSSTTLVPGTIVRRPSSASIAPATSFISVVLPAPLRPISASRSRSPI